MAGEYLTRYTQRNLRMAKFNNYISPRLDPSDVAFFGKEGALQRREELVAYSKRLSTINIDDPDSQLSIFAQAVSAVNSYPKERRNLHPNFNAFAYLMEPNRNRYLVADVEGTWDLNNQAFEFHSIVIHEVRDSAKEIESLMNVIQTLNPGIPKISSDSFDKFFSQATEETEK